MSRANFLLSSHHATRSWIGWAGLQSLWIAATVLSLLGLPSLAAAASYQVMGDAGEVYIGMVDHDGSGSKAWLCDAAAGGDVRDGIATWHALGDASGLSTSWIVAGGGGNDHIRMVNANLSLSAAVSDCVGVWTPLLYNGYYLDLSGDAGDDNLLGGFGDTWVFGGDGHDHVDVVSPIGRGYGGPGDDVLLARSAGSSVAGVLDAGLGDDCIEVVRPEEWAALSCGTGNDRYYESGVSTPVFPADCETPIATTCKADALQGPVTVASGGSVIVPVVVDPSASPQTRATASTLANLLTEISGAPFVVTESSAPIKGIRLGLVGAFGGASSYAPTVWSGLGEAASSHFFARSGGQLVTLAAQTEQSLRNAMWEMLATVGYRQYAPRATWEVVPSMSTLTFDVALDQHPRYASRRVFFGFGQWPETQPAYDDWSDKNGMQGGPKWDAGHSWQAIIADRAGSFAAHPQWRGVDPDTGAPTDKLCVQAPGLQELVIDWALERLDNDPSATSISMEPSDGGGWEGCSSDVGLTPSDRVVILANAVAAAVQADHPGTVVTFYAYNQHAAAPSIAVDPNVVVYIATAFNESAPLDAVAAWSTCPGPCVARFGVRDYLGVWTWDHSLPGASAISRPHETVPNLDRYAASGAVAYLAEADAAWGPAGPGFWMAARALSAPDGTASDVDALRDDFLRNAFDDIPQMVEFYGILDGPEASLLSRHAVGTLYSLLDQARSSSRATPIIHERIDDLVLYVRFVELWQNYEHADATGRQSAFETLVRFAYRSRTRMMVHSLGLYRDLDARDGLVSIPAGAQWNEPEATNPWKDSTPFSAAELSSIVSTGIAANPVLPIVRRTFSGPLVPADVDRLSGNWGNVGHDAMYMRDRSQWFTWVDTTTAPPEFDVVAGFVYREQPLEASLWSVSGGTDVLQDEAVVPGTWLGEPASLPWTSVKLQTLETGLHRLELRDGGSAFLFDWPAGRRLVANAGVPVSGYSFAGAHRYSMYFYVPSDATEVAGWSQNFGKLRDSTGAVQLDLETESRPTHFVIPVSPEQRGTMWMCHSCVDRLALLNVPPYLAMRHDELLLPQSVVDTDGL